VLAQNRNWSRKFGSSVSCVRKSLVEEGQLVEELEEPTGRDGEPSGKNQADREVSSPMLALTSPQLDELLAGQFELDPALAILKGRVQSLSGGEIKTGRGAGSHIPDRLGMLEDSLTPDRHQAHGVQELDLPV